MATGWVIASQAGARWQYRIISGDGTEELRLSDDPAEAAALLAGAARIGLIEGHTEAPLVALPADPVAALSSLPADGAWRILPRFSQQNPLMLSAGEELLLAGALAIAPRFDGTILIREAKSALWAQISAGEVVSILRSVTPALLGSLAPGEVQDSTRLTQAAADTLSRPERVSALLASLPAQHRLLGLDAQGQTDVVAGWLLGAEMAAAKAWWLGQPVLLISDQKDGAAEVLAAQGLSLHPLSPAAARLAALKAIAPL